MPPRYKEILREVSEKAEPHVKKAVSTSKELGEQARQAAEKAGKRLKAKVQEVTGRADGQKKPQAATPHIVVEAPEPVTVARKPARRKDVFAWLKVSHGAQEGVRFDLPPGETRIGRKEVCEIHVTGDNDVSREHALIRAKAKEYVLCDTGSRNGTFLNGDQIDRARVLQEGDSIQVGNTVLVFTRQKQTTI